MSDARVAVASSEELVVMRVADLRQMFREVLAEWRPPMQTTPESAPVVLENVSRIETMRILGVTAPTMRDLERRKELVPFRIGRKVMYRRADIERFMGGRR
jgi:hypothetical protein